MDHSGAPATLPSGGQLLSQLLLLVVLIGLNAFFVIIEFAVIVSRRSRIDQMAAEGGAGAKIVQRWLMTPKGRDRLVAASQLGITIVSLALGNQGELTFELIFAGLFGHLQVPPALSGLIQATPLILSLIIVSSFHVVFGEQVPKVAALRNPEGIAAFFANPMRIFEILTSPLVWVLDKTATTVVTAFGLSASGVHSSLYTVEELKQLVRESEQSGVLAESEREMLDAVFDIRDMLTRQVMIPRTEIKMIDADARFEDLLRLATESPHTKFPVYESDPDLIIGVVYVKDLIKAMTNPKEQRTVRSLVREVLLVPENLPVENLLAQFQSRRQQIAIVLDEFGGTAGLVTLEDIIEEIIGDMADQFDSSVAPEIQRLKDGTASIAGLMNIAEFNHEFGLALVDENYDTLGGYVMGQLERIPVVGDKVLLPNGATLRVEAMDGRRVERISLLPASKAPKADAVPAPGQAAGSSVKPDSAS
jgi:CBS domain containing-hemolysin-like protein